MRILGFLLLVLFAASGLAAAPVVLVMGDSVSAAYGIPVESGWVRLLQLRLVQQGYLHRVVNGSVSGETTAGGLARLPSALQQHRPQALLIELGGNDGLRGLPIRELRKNLAAMVKLGRKAGAEVAVFEMQIPPNYGASYARQFQDSFFLVAREQRARHVPFFLAQTAAGNLFQDDGIHPTAAAQPGMLELAWPVIESLLGKAKSTP